eukprot:454675-Pyramimonas_sp.AAC.1
MRHTWRTRRHVAWRTRSTWRIWRTTKRAWHARVSACGAPGTRGAPRSNVAHLGSALVPSSCPCKDDR